MLRQISKPSNSSSILQSLQKKPLNLTHTFTLLNSFQTKTTTTQKCSSPRSLSSAPSRPSPPPPTLPSQAPKSTLQLTPRRPSSSPAPAPARTLAHTLATLPPPCLPALPSASVLLVSLLWACCKHIHNSPVFFSYFTILEEGG
ncbi:hypothetical protein COCCADRAFT_83949 [Bipolaris zeicola 26-R-13]|uniref:Uncharacterized protein n=1 Tax=Cochliobolus carbonum (strain 26-R-13) TaxID=930089 RepID=W6Z359_COCC2|nr:uncharacterized protein COCCADRAFT_83949 [Bipolaris zeicola 26-R-13]EUC38126.1 hypothetical protein COCCADRAFT_83949 [Bipolaris zeicola 26-R-13]